MSQEGEHCAEVGATTKSAETETEEDEDEQDAARVRAAVAEAAAVAGGEAVSSAVSRPSSAEERRSRSMLWRCSEQREWQWQWQRCV
jgi:hypothetical protein